MHKIDEEGTFLIDSPGLKELGIANLERYEISHFFKEMRTLIGKCKFRNCCHINEPQCAIIKAVESGNIHESRYKSYVSILESV
jgi:ribosome biogenesis GTPase